MSASRQVEYELTALTSPADPARELPETDNERLLAILHEVRGPEILHVGCVNHRLPQSPAEACLYLHYQLCRRFADCHVVGLDIEAQAIEQLGKLGFDMVHGDAHDLPYRQAFDTIVAGELLVISQFTLLADTDSGRRPSFIKAAAPDDAKQLYEHFLSLLRNAGVKVETGEFGAMMAVSLVNDGPVTIVLDSRNR